MAPLVSKNEFNSFKLQFLPLGATTNLSLENTEKCRKLLLEHMFGKFRW